MELHIAGAFSQRDSIAESITKNKSLPKVIFHGLVSQEQATKIVSGSDALIFLRDDNPVTRAGYPSKVVHALSLGVPLITNYRSDITLATTGVPAGIFFDSDKEQSLGRSIDAFINISDSELYAMKTSAISVAETAFNASRYVKDTKLFFGGL